MNSKIETKRNKYKMAHATGFTSVHPPGGFVAWPDGTTSRIGERRKGHAFTKAADESPKRLLEWPGKEPQLMRA